MKGPEGQIFGPMAETYAFALGGALLLALTIAPVLCLLLFKNLKPARTTGSSASSSEATCSSSNDLPESSLAGRGRLFRH